MKKKGFVVVVGCGVGISTAIAKAIEAIEERGMNITIVTAPGHGTSLQDQISELMVSQVNKPSVVLVDSLLRIDPSRLVDERLNNKALLIEKLSFPFEYREPYKEKPFPGWRPKNQLIQLSSRRKFGKQHKKRKYT